MNGADKIDWRNVRIDIEKLTEYLLSVTHPRGRSKAAYFYTLGFDLSNAADFIAALVKQASNGVASILEETTYGQLMKVEGIIIAPNARRAIIRSVWLVKPGERNPRLITAYPLKRRFEK